MTAHRLEGYVSQDLYDLAELIQYCQGEPLWGSYGEDFKSEVFEMKRYCWCDYEDCEWCVPCMCSPRYYEHEESGERISPEQFLEKIRVKGQWQAYDAKYFDEDQCKNCQKSTHPENEGSLRGKPYFEHFDTGIKVWWYKHLGRGIEIEGLDGRWLSTKQKWRDAMRECEENVLEQLEFN